jgi:hypothetical protein
VLVHLALAPDSISDQDYLPGPMKANHTIRTSAFQVTLAVVDEQCNDPLFNYLSDYLRVITEDSPDLFKTVNSIFAFLQSRIEQFTTANPKYQKPPGFTLTYSKPSCCPATIVISYLNQLITITSMN